jgi:iron-sulfur cluster repair protein YtfE (RIC family)
MDALDLLIRDHREVKKLLDELESAEGARRKARFETIKSELEHHEAIEEEIFYPALKGHKEARDVVLEGFEEHNVVDRILGELTELPIDDETWAAKFSVMKENLEHHIEEEEGEMFEAARSVLDPDELRVLGERMERRKLELMQG